MKQELLDKFERIFNSEKKFFKDGYYRIRSLSDEQKELAFLVADACGAKVVHPQITIEKRGNDWVAIKLIDLQTTPIKRISRTPETKELLENELNLLVNKFKEAMKDSDDKVDN